jgi:tRNA(fMet)-specific endonuclease VapC
MLTLLQRGVPAVRQHVGAHPPADLAITVITVEEQLSGWYTRVRRAKTKHDLARAYQDLAECTLDLVGWQVLSFAVPAIDRHQQLRGLKLPVGKMDLRIAAIVLENGGVLVTRNARDFRHVPNLVLEDWSQ